MAYSIEIKEKAKKLRKGGFSLKEISKKLGIAKSTASVWVAHIKLGPKARERLQKRRMLGQYKAQQIRRVKRKRLLSQYRQEADEQLSLIKFDQRLHRLLSALLFWCEGASEQSCVEFSNSDPLIIKTFIKLLRSAFNLDERKFRILMHLHEYHDEEKQKEFWSRTTKIPKSQFTKTYWKPHTKKRKRENYPGCIRVSYYDAHIARQLHAWYNSFAKNLRGVG